MPVPIQTNSLPLGIGAQSDDASEFKGLLDEVRIYNRALSSQEIQDLANLTLPLELTFFKAKSNVDFITLHWESTKEKDFYGYELQRSTDGDNFQVVSWINREHVNESNNYQYDDYEVSSGITYLYRLKMINQDGSYQYSKIINASIIDNKELILSVWSIPTYNKIFTILEANSMDKAKFSIINSQGNIIMEKTIDLKNGKNENYFDLLNYPTGIYFFKVKTSKKEIVRKVVKIR